MSVKGCAGVGRYLIKFNSKCHRPELCALSIGCSWLTKLENEGKQAGNRNRRTINADIPDYTACFLGRKITFEGLV